MAPWLCESRKPLLERGHPRSAFGSLTIDKDLGTQSLPLSCWKFCCGDSVNLFIASKCAQHVLRAVFGAGPFGEQAEGSVAVVAWAPAGGRRRAAPCVAPDAGFRGALAALDTGKAG